MSGARSITNVTPVAYADAPLFLFHLLEFLDVDYEIDVDEINARWVGLGADDVWSQLIVKETAEGVELLTATPQTGIYRLEGERMVRVRPATTGTTCSASDEVFYLRVPAPGDYRYKGADLGVIVARGRMQGDDLELTPRCLRWVKALRAVVHGPGGRSGAVGRAARLVQGVTTVPLTFHAISESSTDRDVRRPVRRRLARVPGVVPAGGRRRAARRTWRRGRRCASTCRSWCRPGSGCAGWRAAATRRRACSRTGARRSTSSGCTQAVVRRGAPILVRNYDYDLRRFDGTIW